MQSQQKQASIDYDQNGCPKMTTNTIKLYCIQDSLPQTPQLNQKLYLYEKGFAKIQPLNPYKNLVSLWLNNNKICKIQNLQWLPNLLCLYLNDNQICKIQGFDHLVQLEILNLQKNQIKMVQNMSKLQKLKNFNISGNCLTNIYSIKQLKQLKGLTNLDISKNQIQNSQQIYDLIKQMQILTCLSAKATPYSRGFKGYRKSIVAVLPALKFLDDRPVQEIDHRLSEAWLAGGIQQQKKERNKILKQQQLNQKAYKDEQDQLYHAYRQSNQQQKNLSNESIKIRQGSSDKHQNKKQDIKLQNKINKQQQNVFKQKTEQNQLNKQHIQIRSDKNKNLLWFHQYQKIMQLLLTKYKFDFSEVQPQFNMIIGGINKKLHRQIIRFEKKQLQKIWTQIQIEKRKINKI